MAAGGSSIDASGLSLVALCGLLIAVALAAATAGSAVVAIYRLSSLRHVESSHSRTDPASAALAGRFNTGSLEVQELKYLVVLSRSKEPGHLGFVVFLKISQFWAAVFYNFANKFEL